jgi:hypothetical protein
MQQGVQGDPSREIQGVVDSGVKPLNTPADLSGYTHSLPRFLNRG